MRFVRHKLAVVLVTTLAVLSTAGTPAVARGDDDVRVEGNCSKRAEYKVKASPEDGRIETVRLTPAGTRAANYAFDVTPARLVTDLITERGVCPASEEGLRGLFPAEAQAA